MYRKRIPGRREELVQNVSMMKINYGAVDSDKRNRLAYVAATQVKNWNHVLSVQISLLFNSDKSISKKLSYYWFAGKRYVAKDRLLYKPWEMVVALRRGISDV